MTKRSVFFRLKSENQWMWARWMRLVFVTSKTGHNTAWVYDIRDPLGKVHFKRPGPLAPGGKIKRRGLLLGGGGGGYVLPHPQES